MARAKGIHRRDRKSLAQLKQRARMKAVREVGSHFYHVLQQGFCCSSLKEVLAARAGATYVSPFLGRLDVISTKGVDLIAEIVEMFEVAGIETEIIAASVRNPIHVTECALAGADIATVPYKVIEQMTHHPLTDAGIEKFKKDYIAVFGE